MLDNIGVQNSRVARYWGLIGGGMEHNKGSSRLGVELLLSESGNPSRADSRFWLLVAAGHVLDHLLRPLFAIWFTSDRPRLTLRGYSRPGQKSIRSCEHGIARFTWRALSKCMQLLHLRRLFHLRRPDLICSSALCGCKRKHTQKFVVLSGCIGNLFLQAMNCLCNSVDAHCKLNLDGCVRDLGKQ